MVEEIKTEGLQSSLERNQINPVEGHRPKPVFVIKGDFKLTDGGDPLFCGTNVENVGATPQWSGDKSKKWFRYCAKPVF